MIKISNSDKYLEEKQSQRMGVIKRGAMVGKVIQESISIDMIY